MSQSNSNLIGVLGEPDRKIKYVESCFGITGFAVYMKLLQELSQTEDREIKIQYGMFGMDDLAKKIGLISYYPGLSAAGLLTDIIKSCVQAELFDQKSWEIDHCINSPDLNRLP